MHHIRFFITKSLCCCRKKRSETKRSFADNRTYELRQHDIIEPTSRRSLMSDRQNNDNENGYDKVYSKVNSRTRKRDTTPRPDNATNSRVVKNDDGSYDNFQSMARDDKNGDMYTEKIVDDVYNELNHPNRRQNRTLSSNDEYGLVNAAASSDTYDVMNSRKNSMYGEYMYGSPRELSDEYDVFQRKRDTNVISDTMYDTHTSIAAATDDKSKYLPD
ncbi:uncharacterized protein LOC132555805 [Ylistrum balloti]|uniref:uncharacterized protein LOC132555805 n=1 Tax=Ylistrum balloti TaxID=509963 RepID=UPI002905B8C3|nr:uncharacterized protein LOC132555805 [Ylistrum balloti]